jgi:hypothetical protein
MASSVASGFRAGFLKLNAEDIMLDWLEAIYHKNLGYEQLYILDQGIFTLEEFQGDGITSKLGLQLPIRFVPKTVEKFYRKLVRLQDLLRDNPQITHQELLALVEPELALHYQNVMKQCNNNIMDSLKCLYEQAIDNLEELRVFRKRVSRGEGQLMTESVIKALLSLDLKKIDTKPFLRLLKNYWLLLFQAEFLPLQWLYFIRN